MIYYYDHTNLNRWERGELQVRIDVLGRPLPMGYCDGLPEDEAELRSLAESENVDDLPIRKKLLKTGRQIWTVGHPPEVFDEDDD